MENNSNIPPENIELIDSFLLGTMTAQDQEKFRERLQADPEFSRQYDELRLMSLAIQETSLRNKLNEFHRVAETPAKAKVRSINWQRWISAAAVVVVLIGAWFLFDQPSKEQKIFANYYKPDPGLVTTMGGTEEYDFNHAMISYKSGKYDVAITEWKQLLTANPTSDTLNYFVGSSYMALGNWQSSVQYYELVLKNDKSVFLSDTYWYISLCYLRLGKKELALQYLGLSNHKNRQALIEEYTR